MRAESRVAAAERLSHANRRRFMAVTFSFSLVLIACGDPSSRITQPNEAALPDIRNSTLQELMSSLARIGCSTATDRTRPSVEIRAGDGNSARFECPLLEAGELAELGRTYSHIVRQPTGRRYQSAGYWGYETTWKEYCLVNMVTKEVVTCGIWIPTDVPKWFGSTEEPDVQFDEWWDSPGNGGVLNATPTQEVDETPKECDQEIQPDCLRPLTAKDRLLVTDALAAYSRPEAEFSDSDALLACTTLFLQPAVRSRA